MHGGHDKIGVPMKGKHFEGASDYKDATYKSILLKHIILYSALFGGISVLFFCFQLLIPTAEGVPDFLHIGLLCLLFTLFSGGILMKGCKIKSLQRAGLIMSITAYTVNLLLYLFVQKNPEIDYNVFQSLFIAFSSLCVVYLFFRLYKAKLHIVIKSCLLLVAAFSSAVFFSMSTDNNIESQAWYFLASAVVILLASFAIQSVRMKSVQADSYIYTTKPQLKVMKIILFILPFLLILVSQLIVQKVILGDADIERSGFVGLSMQGLFYIILMTGIFFSHPRFNRTVKWSILNAIILIFSIIAILGN
jgi:hypothetical protein